MATTITNKSTNPFYLVDPVTYAEFADRIVVYTSAEPGAELIGSGINPTVRLVAADVNTDVAGSTDITLTNMTVRQGVYGGIIVSSNADPAKPKISKKYIDTVTAELAGDTSVTIQNGSYKEIYGGGGGFNSTVTGDAMVNYYGGNASAIYGGGSDGAIVEGDASVNIIGSPAGGRISKIYGGGKDAIVLGDTTVTFSSDANLINFTGTVYGGGKGKKSVVGGDRTLVFDNYSGDFNASIKDFTNIQFIGSTTVTVNKKLDKSVSGAIYEFVLTDESLQNVNAMLTLTKKHDAINNVVVTIESQEMVNSGGTVYLIESSFFRAANSFNASTVLVQNSSGQQISEVAYNIIYEFDKREGGSVAIEYLGGNLILDGTETEKVILSDADDEVNIVGGTLMAGLDTDGGDDIVNVQSGSTVNGGLSTGTGDDTLYIQKDTQVNGYINMDGGNDRLVVNESASLSSDVIMGDGENTIDVNRYATITGRIILEDGSTNVVNVKGGGISGVDSGDSTTTNTFIFDGFYDNSYVCTDCSFEYERYSGGVGSWQEVFIPDYDYYDNGYYVSVFVREDLVLGDSQDTVIFNSNAAVDNVFMGGGNDVLIINNDAFISESIYMGDGDDLLIIDEDIPENSIDDIYLGAGNDVLELGTSHFSQLYANEGENVIIAKTHMTIDAEFMNLGATGSVLVIDNGAIVEVTGMSLGNFLSVQNEAVYLDQNASVISHGMQFIQNYTGHMTVASENDLVIQAAPGLIPTAVAPYINTFTTGVDSSEIYGGAGLWVQEGANVLDSELTFVGDADVDGTVESSDLMAANAVIGEAGTVVDSVVEVSGDVDVDGTVDSSDILAGGVVGINGSLLDSTVEAQVIDVDGVVTNSDLSATWINVNVGSLTGSLTATGDVDFSVDFFNDQLVVDAPRIELTTDGILVTIATTTATTYDLNNDALLVQVDDDAVVAGPITMDVDLGALGWTNVILTGTVDADVAFDGNTVIFAGGAPLNEVFSGLVTLDGDNTFVITVDSWFDWQQLVFNPLATLGFELADYTLMSVDGYVDVDPMTTIVDQTVFGQNSSLALGEWIYIQDWDANFILPNEQNAFPQGNATNLPWENVYILENAQIWGAVALDNEDNELVISDGVEINGQTALYDYAAVLTLGGDDTVTVGEATINGTIKTDRDIDSGNDELILNGSTVNAAINQGVPAIEMGAGDDDAHITDSLINGDIDMGAGADTLIIDPTTVNGDIDLGSGDDIAEILDSTINGSITGGEGADDLLVDTSSVEGGISLDAGDDILAIVDSTIEVGIDTGADNDIIDILGSTINGDIDAGTGNDTVTITDSNTTINGDVLLGTGDNSATLSNSVVTGSIIGDSGNDDVGLSDGSLVQTDVILGDGNNTAVVVDSEIVGDLLGGSGDDEVTLTTAVIGGGIDLGSGGDNDILSGDATVVGDVVMGTQQVLDELDVPIVPWDTTADNFIQVNPGSTLAVGGDVLMAGADNEIDVEGTLDVTGDVQMIAGDPQTNLVELKAGGGTINVGGSMTMINNASSGSNQIEFQQGLLAPGGDSALVISGPLTMVSDDNTLWGPWYDLADDEELVVGDVNNTFQASAVDMIGFNNSIGMGVGGNTDGSYDDIPTPDLHVISRLELANTNVVFEAPVTMDGVFNSFELGMFLYADQEGDIFVNGDTTVTATGGVAMYGDENYFAAGIDLEAGEQSLIEVNGSTQVTFTGDVYMESYSVSTNEAELGLYVETFEAPDISTSDGEVIIDPLTTQNTLIDGSLTMVGTGTENYLDIYSNVTVTGAIVMGTVMGDALSAYNELTLWDPGSCTFGSTITLTAAANDVILLGDGDVTGLTSIYGGENYLFVGPGIVINDIVSFGGVYDADMIGTEGYQIIANLFNEVEVQGTVAGIDTTIDLGTPAVDFVNDSIDFIYVHGGTVGAYGIITGNSGDYGPFENSFGDDIYHDTVIVEGGLVGGPISMGNNVYGNAYGTNTLEVLSTDDSDPDFGPAEANVLGDVSMQSGEDNNILDVYGATVGDPDSEAATEYRATIDGNVEMLAVAYNEDGDLSGGTNYLNLGTAATITGDVLMQSGDSATNDVDVYADWIREYYDGMALVHTYDGTSDVNSLTMIGDNNEIDVRTGTFIINELPGVNGLSMTQDQIGRTTAPAGVNDLHIHDEAAMVMESDILQGNTYTADPSSFYQYTTAIMVGEYEFYIYNNVNPANPDLFDTQENIILVDGKLFTGNVAQVGVDNLIEVTGPASTSVDTSGGAYDLTAALFDGGTVTQNGNTNDILVGINGTPGPGEALFVSGDVSQWGIDGGAGLIPAEANLIDVADNAGWDSGSITQLATDTNDITISGYNLIGGIMESNVDGPILQVASNGDLLAPTGDNSADLDTTDVNGPIDQTAMLTNYLSVTGATLVLDYISTVNGDVTQDSLYDGTTDFGLMNGAYFEMAEVVGSVSQTNVWGGSDQTQMINEVEITDSEVTGSVTQMTTNGLNEMDITDSSTGALSQTSTNGYNDLTVDPSSVGSITQEAGIANELIAEGDAITPELTVIGGAISQNSTYTSTSYVPFFWFDVVNGAYLDGVDAGANTLTQTSVWGTDDSLIADQDYTVNQADLTDSTVGDITQTTTNGVNDLDITDSTAGNIVQTSTNGSNTLDIDPSDVGNVDMNAGIDNTLVAQGEFIDYELTPVVPDPLVDDEIVADTNVVEKTTIGTIDMTADTGSNSATLDMTDAGTITMEADLDNYLEVNGYLKAEVVARVGSQNEGAILAPEELVTNTIGAVTQTSNTTDTTDMGVMNGAYLYGAIGGNAISQTNIWGEDDSLLADQTVMINEADINDSVVGDVTQMTTNGLNEMDIVDSTAGAVSMTSTNGYNDLYVDPSTVGTIDMTAGIANEITAFGDAITPDLTTIGDLTQVSTYSANAAVPFGWFSPVNGAFLYGVDGDAAVSQSSVWATDELDPLAIDQDTLVNDIEITDGAFGDITQTTTNGINDLDISDSTVGAISQTSTNGSNDLYIDPSTVASITMDAGIDNDAVLADTDVTGALSMTTVDGGTNTLTMSDGSVGAGIFFVGGGAISDERNTMTLDTVTVVGGIDTGTGISDITVTGGSSVTGGIATDGGSDSVSVKGTSVVDSVDTGAGDDRVNLNDSGVITGDIDVGTGSDRVVTTQAALDVSKVVFDEEVRISGGTTSFTVTDDNLGFAGQTLTLDDTGGVSTLTLGQLGTAGSTTDGVLGTVSTSGLDAVILDASGLVNGDTLVNAEGATDWDTMNDGDTVQILVDQLTDGDSIVLVDGYEVGGELGNNLDTWYNGGAGVTDIDLSIDGGAAVSLTFVDQPGVDDGIYQYTNGSDQWTLSFDDANDKLEITYTVIP